MKNDQSVLKIPDLIIRLKVKLPPNKKIFKLKKEHREDDQKKTGETDSKYYKVYRIQ